MSDWEQIRQKYPNSWVLVEAIDARTEQGKRVFQHMDLLDSFGGDFKSMWDCYKVFRERHPDREYVFYHTRNAVIDITVIENAMIPWWKTPR